MDLSESVRAEARAFIEANLALTPVAELPGVTMHLAGPRSGLARLQALNPDFAMPYWAHIWGGGRALIPFLAERPEAVAGRRVLDLGSGSGVVSIAAAKARAARIFAIDVDPYAVVATELNTGLNGVSATCLWGDAATTPLPPVDVLLVGDVFYEYGLAEKMTALLDGCLAAGQEVLVGDPLREFLPMDRLEALATYEARDFGSAAPGPAAVFRYTAAK
ncbi:50S ribosomal protein L11 methyltransferase [Caulobacter sp. NIBR1757]|uniref:class I SAM-dependent methyltransferase n=1 Tax=Caulobacter sp. NIBR1757 TaxID=3016000 RepID=UPI0022F0B5E6|nr:50S ribosomal protein L11 methyltransferase [Caulobacter sp. NIBR1757]WGM39487.1 hypothetical protein AMEJIAPC_02410 [Caulobacter sp. NIBR1757]